MVRYARSSIYFDYQAIMRNLNKSVSRARRALRRVARYPWFVAELKTRLRDFYELYLSAGGS